MDLNLMSKKMILFDMEAGSRKEVISQMADLLNTDGRLLDRDGYEKDVLSREAQGSTAVGFLTATPHAKSEHVGAASLAFARLKEPIKWDGDGREEASLVSLIFQVAVPSKGQGDRHLEILAGLFRKLIYDEFREALLSADTKDKILELVGQL